MSTTAAAGSAHDALQATLGVQLAAGLAPRPLPMLDRSNCVPLTRPGCAACRRRRCCGWPSRSPTPYARGSCSWLQDDAVKALTSSKISLQQAAGGAAAADPAALYLYVQEAGMLQI